jgi:hypothetical protein
MSPKLNGRLNPGGAATYYFEYGTEPCGLSTCGTKTAEQGPLVGDASEAVSFEATGLNPNTTYHYWIVARNAAAPGGVHGEAVQFTTPMSTEEIAKERAELEAKEKAKAEEKTEAEVKARAQAEAEATEKRHAEETTKHHEAEAAARKRQEEEAAATKQQAEQVKALLAGLKPVGKNATIAGLLKQGGFTLQLKAPEAGTIVIDWYQAPPGATLAKKAKAKPLLVASGRLTFTAAGTAKMKIELTAAGKGLLRRAKRSGQIKLTGKGTFTPTGKTPVSATTVFVLER